MADHLVSECARSITSGRTSNVAVAPPTHTHTPTPPVFGVLRQCWCPVVSHTASNPASDPGSNYCDHGHVPAHPVPYPAPNTITHGRGLASSIAHRGATSPVLRHRDQSTRVIVAGVPELLLRCIMRHVWRRWLSDPARRP